MTTKQLSENEIWDDSALVQSWNEALDEYKKYHSMAARGERVEDVLDAFEKEEAESTANLKNGAIDETTGLPPWESVEEAKQQTQEHTSAPEIQPAEAQTTSSTANHPTPPNISQVLLDSVQEEGLKALMTSWYFAGYYTGLYEGQRKAQTENERSTH